MNLLSTAIPALMSITLAVDAPCHKETNLLTAYVAIKFMMEAIGNENSEIIRELQTALQLRTSYGCTNVLQVLQYLQSGTQDSSEIFPKLINGTTAKIILRSIKRLSPSENDGERIQP